MDTPSPAVRTRRALIVGAGGALAALAAQALGRPFGAHAAGDEGDPMTVGGDHLGATSATQLKNSVSDNDVFIATSTRGGRAVYGKAAGGVGVQGRTETGRAAVEGISASSSSAAVRGVNGAAGSAGTIGTTEWGVAGSGPGGVQGTAGTGDGVSGFAEEGTGVRGRSPYGTGVAASSSRGTALRATGEPYATALEVRGPATFDRSGTATVRAGQDRVAVALGRLDARSFVLATLQQYRAGIHVAAAFADPARDRIVIRLDRAVGSDTRVAYQVLETS